MYVGYISPHASSVILFVPSTQSRYTDPPLLFVAVQESNCVYEMENGAPLSLTDAYTAPPLPTVDEHDVNVVRDEAAPVIVSVLEVLN